MSQPFVFPGRRSAPFPRVCPLSVERIFVSGSDIALALFAVFNTNCGFNRSTFKTENRKCARFQMRVTVSTGISCEP